MIEKRLESTKNQSVRVAFHALAAGGEGVGRDETGKTVFAPFAAPGDVALVDLQSEKASFARGIIHETEVFSPQRVAPPCPQFRPETPLLSCGGCSWQHVDLGAQRDAKRDIVQSALTRIGGQDVEVEATRGGAGYAYRNKADFVLGRAKNEAQIGFFADSSHDLIDARVCPIQATKNEATLRAAREILSENPNWAFDAHSGRGIWRRLVARVSSAGEGLATLVTSGEAVISSDEIRQIAHKLRDKVPHLVGVLAQAPRGETQILWGRDYLMESANGLDFRVSGAAFWQVNAEMSPLLARAALEVGRVQGGEKALDLFCGAGLFALHMARAGALVTGIESNRGAVRDAIWNAEHNDLRAEFRAGDAARELKKFKKGDFDLVLLDPPRAGARECIDFLPQIAAQRIVYVSCDPATLSRDAKLLAARGYQLRRAIPFDLFPQTAHIEVVALFERDS
ncbi:23S rRNA (uracil1939-C5)-methyltransferase [Abditibacterium utsteinense]|uniref:23S rRNA (Uracil1939-C5)-methyltransferase n=1 Tax=Abditibacterium utsteinense TaxID=1960156 RepID=A0A2S8SP58_9BACT|nr:23S rRNA (uracil(1939)-C(5))-methyltransferase RlmD [Abditibacterium utsteinense]PQV62577.1 23S rRNA (uracil1939-C5)-methyltransferase [Abditibacterium utsteinense]